MFTYDLDQNVENLDFKSRLLWIAVGSVLIASVFISSATPLGYITLLPLIAVAPMFFAVTGWNAFTALYTQSRYSQSALNLSVTTRVALAVVGVAMLSVAYFAPGSLGYLSVFPLLAIVPIFTAIIGQDPIAVFYNLDSDQSAVAVNEPSYKVVDIHTKDITDKGRREDDHHHIAA